MGKKIKTKAAQEVKTLESVGGAGQAHEAGVYPRETAEKPGEVFRHVPDPPLGEGDVTNQARPENPDSLGSSTSAKEKTLKIPSPGERMKAAFLKAKKAAVREQPAQQNQQEDPSAQAVGQVSEAGKHAADSVLHRAERTGRESLSQVKPRVEQAREKFPRAEKYSGKCSRRKPEFCP